MLYHRIKSELDINIATDVYLCHLSPARTVRDCTYIHMAENRTFPGGPHVVDATTGVFRPHVIFDWQPTTLDNEKKVLS